MKPSPDPEKKSLLLALSASPLADTLSPERSAQLLGELVQRVHHSVLAHRDQLTVRREQGRWSRSAAGVSKRRLRADDSVEIDLLRLAPGTPLPGLGRASAQEWLLLEGCLCSPEPTRPDGDWPPLSYRVVGLGTQTNPNNSTQANTAAAATWACSACLLYRRRLRRPQWLAAEEGPWWRQAMQQTAWAAPSASAWAPGRQGVSVLPLSCHAGVASVLVRLAGGAWAADQAPPLSADFMVLQGELGLGDLLLRAGDCQFVPAGATPISVSSEGGALFYFHGAADHLGLGPLAHQARVPGL